MSLIAQVAATLSSAFVILGPVRVPRVELPSRAGANSVSEDFPAHYRHTLPEAQRCSILKRASGEMFDRMRPG